MGVTGLWRLIEPAGKPVPIETLENKVLAVDISIWLHQVVKGYQDAKGAPLPNAHLIGLFQRLCKLLYFRIKPVFVFDGGFPDLKKETIAKRQINKSKYNSESERLKRELALLFGKKTAIGALLGTQISPKKNKNTQAQNDNDIFKLPALPQKEEESESDSEDEQNSSASTVDLHSVDIESDDFKNMPVKEKYDLLIELKDTRKMNSWGKLHTLPEKSDNFSDFQMQRLLKRRKVQECLQETEKEMGDVGMSLNELESFLNEEGIETKIEQLPTRRIASNNTTRFILINDVQQALANAKKREEAGPSDANDVTVTDTQDVANEKVTQCGSKSSISDEESKADKLDDDLEKAIKMSLECVEDPNIIASKTDDSWTSYKSDTDFTDNIGSDSEDDDGFEKPDYSSAKAYIMQYSDFTYKAINNIVSTKSKGDNKNKKKYQDVNEIIEEINHEKSVIVDKVDVSTSEDEQNNYVTKSSGKSPILTAESKLEGSNQISKEIINDETQSEVEKCTELTHSVVDLDTTQSSVVYIEKNNDIITLDTSSDDILENHKLDITHSPANKNQSDTSDDEFEEVSDTTKPAVQVTLNMPYTVEDDIFADVFDEKESNLNVSTEKLNNDMSKRTLHVENFCGNESKSSDVDLTVNINSDKKATLELAKKAEIKENSNCNKDQMKESDKNMLPDTSKAVAAISSHEHNVKVISRETLNSMVAGIENEEQILQQEKGRIERISRNITEQMTKDAQELLQIFGIPYIIAPMEAEAQCAFLESVNLTDGTITDDSDIWLFGGRTVYKNFFNQKKHVLQFLSEKIEKSFNLSREQLILLALLVGSDYTTGVSGVGPVTALEILASFPFNKKQLNNEDSKHGQYHLIVKGLQEFKTWVRAGRRTDNISLKKKLRNVNLGDDFPSVRVVQAYMDPNVEKSEEKFSWGELDITILRDYAKAKFGWSQNKLDVILQPVIKRMSERKKQKTVRDYFKTNEDNESLENQMSKRVKAAVQKMDVENENIDLTAVAKLESTGKPELRAGNKRKGTTRKHDNIASTSATGAQTKKKKIVDRVKVCTTIESGVEIKVVKTDRYQEIIPQRENDMKNILQNKLKAIELFRKTKIDRKRKPVKKRVILPKDKADLSESSDSN